MDTTLVGVTLISMAMALALSIVVWRLLRDERRRSEARVAALVEFAAHDRREPAPHVPESQPADVGGLGRVARRQATQTIRPAAREHESFKETVPAANAIDLPLRDRQTSVQAPLFSTPQQASPWSARAIVMAALALTGAAVVLFGLAAHNRVPVENRTAAAGNNAAAVAVPPLELLSLRDVRDDATLTITGLVQNPRGGTTLKRVTVTAILFDRTGGFLTSSQTLLDVTSLAPGDESPFVLSVPVRAAVARYRIGFRSEDGRVISHIDKRQQGPVATTAGVAPGRARSELMGEGTCSSEFMLRLH